MSVPKDVPTAQQMIDDLVRWGVEVKPVKTNEELEKELRKFFDLGGEEAT